MKKWLIGVIALVLGLAGGAAAVWAGWIPHLKVEQITESHDSQVVQRITREKQIVLVSLGIQGIWEEKTAKRVLGHDVPGTGRTLFLQYNYTAKLGMDGRAVTIKPTGEKAYTVSIPSFQFLGHDGVSFKTAVEKNGVISWVSPQIDTANVITRLMNDQTRQQHVNDNKALLQDQARSFYTDLIRAIEPDAKIQFEFRDKS